MSGILPVGTKQLESLLELDDADIPKLANTSPDEVVRSHHESNMSADEHVKILRDTMQNSEYGPAFFVDSSSPNSLETAFDGLAGAIRLIKIGFKRLAKDLTIINTTTTGNENNVQLNRETLGEERLPFAKRLHDMGVVPAQVAA